MVDQNIILITKRNLEDYVTPELDSCKPLED